MRAKAAVAPAMEGLIYFMPKTRTCLLMVLRQQQHLVMRPDVDCWENPNRVWYG